MQTQVDLFPSAVADSPRASWHRTHGIFTREYHAEHQHGKGRWICANTAMTRVVCKDTEDGAEQEFCALFGITWWKLADWNGAMGDVPIVRAYSPVDKNIGIAAIAAPHPDWDNSP